MTSLKIDTRSISDWNSFHDVFAAALGFPASYGRNLDAWIDCMTSLDDPRAGMSKVHAPRGGVLTLVLDHVGDFATRCPELFTAIQDSSAFVNWRRLEKGQAAVLALAFFRDA